MFLAVLDCIGCWYTPSAYIRFLIPSKTVTGQCNNIMSLSSYRKKYFMVLSNILKVF